jgi:hemerythrin
MTTDKIILEASTFPRVDIDFMNNTHFDELDIVQQLGQLITAYQQNGAPSDDDSQQITQAFENWIEHSHSHFYRENALMQEVGFPMYHLHSAEHEHVLAEILEVFTSWKMTHDIEAVAAYVFYSWPTWFNTHVNTMDIMTAQFAVMNGYSPNSVPS